VRYSEKILEAQGISIETLDLSKVLGRIERMKDNDDAAHAKLAAIRKCVDVRGVPQAALMKMAKLGAVVDHWMAATEVAVSAVQCWTSSEENPGVVPCTIMSMMSEGLLSSACEVDICGVLGTRCGWLRRRRRRCSTGTKITAPIPTRQCASIAPTCPSTFSARSRWISTNSSPAPWARKTPSAPA
jgi:hypothetical protein